MFFFNIISVIIIIFAIFSFFRELSRYKFTHNVASLLVRLACSILLGFMMISMLIGVHYFDLLSPIGIYNVWMIFWMAQFMLAVSIMILSFVEIKYFKINEKSKSNKLLKDDIEKIIRDYEKRSKDDNQ